MNKKMQYSKIIPIVTCLIFCICLFEAFIADYTTIIDVSLYATAITVSGGLFGSAIIWYMKKSAAENTMKIKIELYKQASQERINYNKQMMILRDKYNLSDEDLRAIDEESPLAPMMDNALSSAENSVDNALEDAVSDVEIPTY